MATISLNAAEKRHGVEAAKKQAAQQKKDLLIDFTGSAWCPPCIALHKNVFSKPEFTRQMSQHYVFISLDFPRNKSKQTAKTIEQNAQLNADKTADYYQNGSCDPCRRLLGNVLNEVLEIDSPLFIFDDHVDS